MSEQPDDIRQWIQELISRSATDQMDNLKRFDELVRRAARGDVDQSKLRDEYVRYSKDESLRYINDLTRVGLNFYNTLLELNRDYNERFFDRVLRERWSQNGVTPSAKREPNIVTLEIDSPLGQVAEHAFVIENHRKENVSVSFLVSDFTDAASTESFRPPLQLMPARFTLRPAEEQEVTLRIPALKELFRPGEQYHATIMVSGFDDLQLRLVMHIDAPGASPDSGISIQPKARPAAPKAEPASGPAAKDDLSRIKGIGPAYQKKLAAAGVVSYAQIASLNDQQIDGILGSQGLARANRSRWREQAALAASGDWQALDELQAGLA